MFVPSVQAFTLAGLTTGKSIQYAPSYTGGDNPGMAILDPVNYLAPYSSEAYAAASLVNSAYPPNIPYVGTGLGGAATGTVTITQYDIQDGAAIVSSLTQYVQAILEAKLTNNGNNNYRWLQIVDTNAPSNGHTSSSYIDDGPPGMGDELPFYWDDPHESTTFYDTPTRPKPARNGVVYWHANLFLCSYDPVPGQSLGITIEMVFGGGSRWRR